MEEPDGPWLHPKQPYLGLLILCSRTDEGGPEKRARQQKPLALSATQPPQHSPREQPAAA